MGDYMCNVFIHTQHYAYICMYVVWHGVCVCRHLSVSVRTQVICVTTVVGVTCVPCACMYDTQASPIDNYLIPSL